MAQCHIYASRFRCLFPQRPRYVALISVLISPVPDIWGVTNGSLLASPPNSRCSPASLISPAPHICGASRTPILTRVVWKILNVVTKILVVLPDYRLPLIVAVEINGKIYTICCNLAPFIVNYQTLYCRKKCLTNHYFSSKNLTFN